MHVQPLGPDDVDEVAAAVGRRLADEARRHSLVYPSFDHDDFTRALRAAGPATWVARRDHEFAGHLFGAVLDDGGPTPGAWVGPDGVSFDAPEILFELYAHAGAAWIELGASEHFVWTIDDERSTAPWAELGFARVHQRGSRLVTDGDGPRLPAGLRLRAGGVDDVDAIVRLDEVLDEAQRSGPSFLLTPGPPTTRADVFESLQDPDTRHFVVDVRGDIIAQCQTFTLPPLRGTHPNTLHLSGLSVLPEWRRHGVAAALVGHALHDGYARGHTHADVTWRVTNHAAGRFWRSAGFTPTFVRLHRTVGRF